MSDHIIQVLDNEEKKKACNLISLQSRGQYRRWVRHRTIKGKKEKGLNPKGERGIHEEESALCNRFTYGGTLAMTRAQHTQEMIAEIFGVWDSNTEKAQRQAHAQSKHQLDMIGRALGIGGFHVTIHPGTDEYQWAEVVGKNKDGTTVTLRVYLRHATIIFQSATGNQSIVKKGVEHVVANLPNTWHFVPNFATLDNTSGVYMAAQSTLPHRHQWLLTPQAAHTHLQQIEQSSHAGQAVHTGKAPLFGGERPVHTPEKDMSQRQQFMKWAWGTYGPTMSKWTEKQFEAEYHDWTNRNGLGYHHSSLNTAHAAGIAPDHEQPTNGLGGAHEPLRNPRFRTEKSDDGSDTLVMEPDSYDAATFGHPTPHEPQPGFAGIKPPLQRVGGIPPRGLAGNIYGTDTNDYGSLYGHGYDRYSPPGGYQDTRRRETPSTYAEVNPYQSSFGREGTETMSGREKPVFRPSAPFSGRTSTSAPQPTHTPEETNANFVFHGPEEPGPRIPADERAHRRSAAQGEPWVITHPAVERIKHVLENFGPVKVVDMLKTSRKAIYLTAQGGTVVLMLTLSGRNNKGHQLGTVWFLQANLEPTALQYFFSLIPHLVLLDGGGQRPKQSRSYPIHWVNNFTSLVDQVKKGAPQELVHLAAALEKIPKGNKKTGMINRQVRSMQGIPKG